MNYKFGDRVLVVDDKTGHGFPIGSKIKILEVSEHFEHYKACLSNVRNEKRHVKNWYINEDELAQPKKSRS